VSLKQPGRTLGERLSELPARKWFFINLQTAIRSAGRPGDWSWRRGCCEQECGAAAKERVGRIEADGRAGEALGQARHGQQIRIHLAGGGPPRGARQRRGRLAPDCSWLAMECLRLRANSVSVREKETPACSGSKPPNPAASSVARSLPGGLCGPAICPVW